MRFSRGTLRILLLSLCVPLAGIGAPGIAFAQEPLAVEQLLSHPEEFSETEITIEGELVGDYGFRSDGFMWTQLNDDSYARAAIVDGGPRTGGNIGVGVRMPVDLARDLDPVGGYRLEGPLVQLTGTWKYHDPDRGGESYLDAEQLRIVEPGRRLEEGPDWVVFTVGVGLLLWALALWVVRRRRPA